VDITIPADQRLSRPGIREHRTVSLEPDERMVLGGLPVTAPGRTLLDMTVEVGSRELEAMVARAQRAELLDRDALVALLDRYRGRGGIAALRAVLATPEGPALTRSEAEARFLELVRRAGLPAPRSNVKLGRYEIDFLWSDERIAVEVDGFRYHSSRSRFEGDRRKDAWLTARGIRVIRLSWRQIVESAVPTIVQVGQALAKVSLRDTSI
jgi:very-short-patch-repair endonuclease